MLSPAKLWLGIGLLIGLNIWMGNNLLGTVLGWQLFWAENDVIVLLAAVSVANLYVQGGMKLRHVAWFALVLAGYDVVFTSIWPVTNELVEEFLGYPLDPSIGMRWGFDNAAIGLGDLLVYALFVLAAFKAYGRRAGQIALAVVVVVRRRRARAGAVADQLRRRPDRHARPGADVVRAGRLHHVPLACAAATAGSAR